MADNVTLANITITEIQNIPFEIWGSLRAAFIELANSVIKVLPGLIAATVILVFGWIVAKIIGLFVKKTLQKLGFDEWIKKNRLDKAVGNAKLSKVAGTISSWYIFIIFLAQIVEYVKLEGIHEILQEIILNLPVLFGGAVIVIFGLILGEYLRKSSAEMQIPYYDIFGGIAKFFVVYITLVIGLQTIGIDTTILIQAFSIGLIGIVLTIALSLGLGFGLAIKEEAKKIVRSVKKKI